MRENAAAACADLTVFVLWATGSGDNHESAKNAKSTHLPKRSRGLQNCDATRWRVANRRSRPALKQTMDKADRGPLSLSYISTCVIIITNA